jgi:hypothetical protein
MLAISIGAVYNLVVGHSFEGFKTNRNVAVVGGAPLEVVKRCKV